MSGTRQPIELVKLKGKKHLTKAEIKKRESEEIKVGNDKVIAPGYLSEKQKKQFDEIAKQLIEINIMSNIDCDLLARFIIAQDLYLKFTKAMNSKEAREDIFMLEKYSSLQDKYFKQCQSTSKELGLGISSRCKISVPKSEEKPKNKFEKFGGANG